MSTLWTPSGEHPVDRPGGAGSSRGDSPGAGRPGPSGSPGSPAAGSGGGSGAEGPGSGGSGPAGPGSGGSGAAGPSGNVGVGEAGEAERLEELRHQLAEAPAEVVVANHCFGLFELAAVYLSQPEPRLAEARLAIDALGALVDGLAGRLGEPEPSLKDALAQLRLAFVQIESANRGPTPPTNGERASGAADPG